MNRAKLSAGRVNEVMGLAPLPAGLALLVFSLAVWAGVWGYADYLSLNLRNELHLWEVNALMEKSGKWEDAVNDTQFAASLNPYNPEYRMYLGKVNEWKALSYPTWDHRSKEERDKAINEYRAAILKRPSWSVAWGSIGMTNFYNLRVKETFDAMDKAVAFGPWDHLTQMKALWIGFSMWDHLSEKQKSDLVTVMKRTLSGPPGLWKQVIGIAVGLGKEEALQVHLAEQEHRDLMQTELANRKARKSGASPLDTGGK